jgi:hypothetical protein
MNRRPGVRSRSQLAEPRRRLSNSSNACGLHRSHDVGANGLGQVGPSGQDHGQVWVFGQNRGSAFGSATRPRHAAQCRSRTGTKLIMLRRNTFAAIGFSRDIPRDVATRRKFRKSGGGGNCTRRPEQSSGSDHCHCPRLSLARGPARSQRLPESWRRWVGIDRTMPSRRSALATTDNT